MSLPHTHHHAVEYSLATKSKEASLIASPVLVLGSLSDPFTFATEMDCMAIGKSSKIGYIIPRQNWGAQK